MPKPTLILKHIRSFFPSKLPTGMTEINQWLNDIVELAGPIANERDMHFVLCSILIHADIKYGSLPKRYFVTRLIKSAANQVASKVFQDIKIAQAEELEAQKLVAVTTPTESVTDNAQKALN